MSGVAWSMLHDGKGIAGEVVRCHTGQVRAKQACAITAGSTRHRPRFLSGESAA